jgi:hypothetical protein
VYKYRFQQDGYLISAITTVVICLTLGALYYLCFRALSTQPWPLHLMGFELNWVDNFTHGSFPSFVHALALFVCLYTWLRHTGVSRKRGAAWITGALTALLAGEGLLGTTTYIDAFVIVAAAPLSYGLVSRFSGPALTGRVTGSSAHQTAHSFVHLFAHRPAHRPAHRTPHRFVHRQTLVVSVLLSSFALLSAACYVGGDGYGACARYDNDGNCVERVIYADPVYMSYSELRSSIRHESVRPLDDVGRLYAFGNYLFINERNKGIHVFDNTDAFNPQPLSFIAIPGNLDIEIRGNRLYADSFTDLVTLDISNVTQVVVVDRQQDVFAWDAEQNIPYNVRLNTAQVDRTQGVVIGYQE